MFKLDDLTTGDRVVLRDGRFMVVLKNTAVGNVISSFDGGSFMALGSYTQSLKVKRIDPREPDENDRDIVKVMRPCMPAHLLLPYSPTTITVYDETASEAATERVKEAS